MKEIAIDKKQKWFSVGMIAAGVLYMSTCVLVGIHAYGMTIIWYGMLVSSAFGVLLILGSLYLWGEDGKQHPYIEMMMVLMGFWAVISFFMLAGGKSFYVIVLIAAVLMLPSIYIQFRLFRYRSWKIVTPLIASSAAALISMIFRDNMVQGYTEIILSGLCLVFAGIGFMKTKRGKPEPQLETWKIISIYVLAVVVILSISMLLGSSRDVDYAGEEAKAEVEDFLEKKLPVDAQNIQMRYYDWPGLEYETYITFDLPEAQAESWLRSGVDTIDDDMNCFYSQWSMQANRGWYNGSDKYEWYDSYLDYMDEYIIRMYKTRTRRPDWWIASLENTGFKFNDGGYKDDILLLYYRFPEENGRVTLWIYGLHE